MWNFCIHRSRVARVPKILHQFQMTAPVDMSLRNGTLREAFMFHYLKPVGRKVMLLQTQPSERADVVITAFSEEEIIIGTTKFLKLLGAFEDLPVAFDMMHGVFQDSRIQSYLGPPRRRYRA